VCVEPGGGRRSPGFSTLWFAENQYTRGVWPAMAACRWRRGGCGIGIGVFNPYNRHPC